jgi:hypothetical protein
MSSLRHALAMLFAYSLVTTATAQDFGRASLKGIKTAKLRVELSGDDAAQYFNSDLLRSSVKIAIDSKMNNGVTRWDVASQTSPYELIVRINLKKLAATLYAYRVEMALRQQVLLPRDATTTVTTTAETWRMTEFGLGAQAQIRTGVENELLTKHVTQLCLDWLTVN